MIQSLIQQLLKLTAIVMTITMQNSAINCIHIRVFNKFARFSHKHHLLTQPSNYMYRDRQPDYNRQRWRKTDRQTTERMTDGKRDAKQRGRLKVRLPSNNTTFT